MASNNQISIEDEDTRILLNIFPTEVWQLIFNNVHKSGDYTRISNSSATFKSTLLSPHWTRVFLPKILDLVELQCLGYHTTEGRKSLLNLRLVCREWKSAVDSFLQNVPEHFMIDKELDWGHHRKDPRPKKFRAEIKNLLLRRSQDVTHFREKFDATHFPQNRNPFANRQLQTWMVFDLHDFLEYVKLVLNLLRDYGSHVWYFRLRVFLQYDDPTQEVEQLARFGVGNWVKEILSLLPSLRTLRFTFYPDPNWGAWKPPWQQKFAEMQQHWTRNEMPHFPNLSFLGEVGLPWPMLMALLQANSQLKSLESGSLTRAATSSSLYETQMPTNLKHLSIELLELRQLEILEEAKVNWKLEKLCLRARGTLSMDDTLQLARVMEVADSKFGETLRRLYVLCCKRPNISVAPLKMPNLEFFHLCLFGMAPELDFLIPVGPTLKTLYVELQRYVLHRNDELLRYREQKTLSRRNNLWEMLPKLQNFSVMIEPEFREWRWHNVTREQWKWEKDQANRSSEI